MVSEADGWRREAIVTLQCEPEPGESGCRVGTLLLDETPATILELPGAVPPLKLRVSGIVPDGEPHSATLRVRVPARSDVAKMVRVGDRDARWPSIDSRAATVSSLARASSAEAIDLTLRLGVDRVATGWRYHGHALEPGSAFSFVTDRYATGGQVVDMVVDAR